MTDRLVLPSWGLLTSGCTIMMPCVGTFTLLSNNKYNNLKRLNRRSAHCADNSCHGLYLIIFSPVASFQQALVISDGPYGENLITKDLYPFGERNKYRWKLWESRIKAQWGVGMYDCSKQIVSQAKFCGHGQSKLQSKRKYNSDVLPHPQVYVSMKPVS